MSIRTHLGTSLVFVVALSASSKGAIRYAKAAATGLNDCTSWANACTLASALAAASAGDQVWVQAGTYLPLDLKEGVTLIGGFGGTETAASQSNPWTNATNIDGGGVARCLYGENLTTATVIRGFRIVNGYDEYYAGALLLYNSDPVFINCWFENNTAAYAAGAVFARENSKPEFHNCVFRYNGSTASGDPPFGGGAILIGATGSMVAVNCGFYENGAGDGGAVYAGNPDEGFTMSNCTFKNNSANFGRGGGLFDPDGRVTLNNCILWGNTASVTSSGGSQQIFNVLGYTSVSFSDVQGGWNGTNNIDADPLFNNAGSMLISTNSPCKNTGDNALLPADVMDLDWDGNFTEALPKDLQNLLRIKLTVVDMGAYEAIAGGGGGGGQ